MEEIEDEIIEGYIFNIVIDKVTEYKFETLIYIDTPNKGWDFNDYYKIIYKKENVPFYFQLKQFSLNEHNIAVLKQIGKTLSLHEHIKDLQEVFNSETIIYKVTNPNEIRRCEIEKAKSK